MLEREHGHKSDQYEGWSMVKRCTLRCSEKSSSFSFGRWVHPSIRSELHHTLVSGRDLGRDGQNWSKPSTDGQNWSKPSTDLKLE